MKKILLPNDIFFSDVSEQISLGNNVHILAKGNSMYPFFRNEKDRLILSKHTQKSFQKGRILLFKLNENKYIVHRLEKIKHDGTFVMRGDGNPKIKEICKPDDVIAEVIAVVKGKREIKQGSFKWNIYRFILPRNVFFRRVYLFLCRKLSV